MAFGIFATIINPFMLAFSRRRCAGSVAQRLWVMALSRYALWLGESGLFEAFYPILLHPQVTHYRKEVNVQSGPEAVTHTLTIAHRYFVHFRRHTRYDAMGVASTETLAVPLTRGCQPRWTAARPKRRQCCSPMSGWMPWFRSGVVNMYVARSGSEWTGGSGLYTTLHSPITP